MLNRSGENLKANQQGFTLIELLAVIAILGILATIAVPSVVRAMSRAREGADRATALTIANAAKQYIIEENEFPGSGAVNDNHVLVAERYLDSVPKPQNKKAQTFFLEVSGDDESPVIEVSYGEGGKLLYPYTEDK